MRSFVLTLAFWLPVTASLLAGWPPDQLHYWRVVQPIMKTYCNQSCHNADDNKAGLNLNRYDFIQSIQRDGEVFIRVIDHIKTGSMPPEGEPQLSPGEKDTLLLYLNKYLDEALAKPDPGLIAARRLSIREYEYAILDLTGMQINADSLFPKDAGGGEGFDNFAGTLYLTPLLMERYFEVAESVVEDLARREDKWRTLVPANRFSWLQKIRHWWGRWWQERDPAYEATLAHAKEAIFPFATLAYRRYLSPEERNKLLAFFEEVYAGLPEDADRYEEGVQEVFKAVLVSPHFLMRQENDPPLEDPYPITDFELASRLSFFLWSSIPDFELLEAAYREDLHRPAVLRAQVRRMLESPKVKRMAESFVTQWLEIERLNDPTFKIDPELFPEFTPALRRAMRQETVEFFYHALTESRNFLELLDSRYTFMNETLAEHYGVEGVDGPEMRVVALREDARGGLLGMASVLTATSLPNRTSPVLRGKWVMEKILNTPAKPPPPNVPELEAAKAAHDELSLRQLLEIHRQDPACSGCHQEMDDLGFALENFDAIGRWRTDYGNTPEPIDVSGSLKSGERFEGVVQLREILNSKQRLFAEGLSKKMLGFALGRSIEFIDKKVVDELAGVLVDNQFDPVPFVEELALSYPFRYKKSDPVVVDDKVGEAAD